MIAHNELVTVFFLNSFEPPVGAVYRVQTRPVGVSGSGGDARPLPGLLVDEEEGTSESCLFRLRGATLDSACMTYFVLVW